ncbi:MAG: GAF domain-containing sensor histidine kinase [Anaerolineae bacterium]
MEGIVNFCQSNLPLIYGLYGLAFFVTGIAVALECGRASQLALARALPFLAAFGLTHGVHEWVEMFGLMVPNTPTTHIPLYIELTNLILLTVSFVCLLEFALRLMRLLEPEKYQSWAWLTWFFTALYLVALLAYRVWGWNGDDALFWRVGDILSRYIIGLIAAVFASLAMFVKRRAFVREGYPQFSADLIGAALAFAWYALFQFVVPQSPYFPSSVFNADSFLAYTGIPVQVFRAGIVSVLAFFIVRVMRVFEIEYARRLEALNHERFTAQENAARELSVLYETCRIMGTTLDLNFLLNEALSRIVTLVEPVRAGTVLLYDAGEHALIARASHQHPNSPIPANFGERARTLALQAFESKQLTYEATPENESLLAIPLISGDQVIGVLALAHEGAFSNLAVLQTLARQLVIAIENARLYEQVQRKEEVRGQLLERVVAAQEDERKRLARDLHDETGQRLTALGLAISSIGELMDKNPKLARERLTEVEEMCTAAIDDLRQFVADLRPSLLDDLGLVAAVRQMAKQVEARSGMTVEFNLSGQRRRLPSQIETVVYRIAQEALNNTVRHAHARAATIDLQFGDQSVVLCVEDNGVGFAPASILKAGAQIRAWGLLGMQERVDLVGGKFEIESAPGRGARLVAEIPYESTGVQVDYPGHAG